MYATFSASFASLREQLVATIETRLALATENGLGPEDLGSAEELTARVGAAIPIGRHPTAALVGPCYDTRGLSRWLGISKQAIDKRNKAHTLLACRTESGFWRYPALQFDDRGNPLPHLRELLDVLITPGDDRRWRAARWLAAPAPYLPGNVSAAAWLRSGSDVQPVLTAARADAARWAA
ncbi:hypothetical protein M6B22_13395 [Jatrophihabitans cynanchi]|uniref:DNA-binding protein n=1 Tax=Jatrophihabitans cynanchi TaxID=2944128 RepID=A0ABY7JU29_9ACTN|nr:hypothetical protein [Jatrophihabitans sp. SB3-54]WAX55535.1 hypothetical protein M6B22_13395 [Jatrophihabitans sp. SB3-54]